MASIGWIDFSTSDRNRIGSVLDLLRPEGMVDELGMGTIRDALANQMFPGISTIQTRAKYFFIVPYILYDYLQLKPARQKSKTPAKYLEDEEYEIMWSLAEKYHHQEGHGVIGITKKRYNKIARRPSAIYWNGLNTYRFLNSHGMSADPFLNQSVNPSMESLLMTAKQGDDSGGDDADAEHENIFHLKVPLRPQWKDNLVLDLHKEEAEFFQDRILSVARHKLIAVLLQNDSLWQSFVQAENFTQFAEVTVSLTIPEDLKAMLILAHDFSELMLGAHIAYNCQLQTKKFGNDSFEERWQIWINNIDKNMLNYSDFHPEVLFGYATSTRPTTVEFVKTWWKLTQNGFPDLKLRDTLIEKQEAMVKGGKARLRWGKTDDVKENSWLGLEYLAYRFPQARTILNDVKKGLLQNDVAPQTEQN